MALKFRPWNRKSPNVLPLCSATIVPHWCDIFAVQMKLVTASCPRERADPYVWTRSLIMQSCYVLNYLLRHASLYHRNPGGPEFSPACTPLGVALKWRFDCTWNNKKRVLVFILLTFRMNSVQSKYLFLRFQVLYMMVYAVQWNLHFKACLVLALMWLVALI